MKTRIAVIHSLIALFLGCGLLFPARPAAAQTPITPEANVDCVFGYKSVSVPNSWKEISGDGTLIDFGSNPYLSDEGLIQVNNIGFNFPFFEKIYSSVFVSTNGFLTFTQYPSAYATNFPIPMEFPPNNIVAGLWDDLTVYTGHVYYKTVVSGTDHYIVIEWYQVNRSGSPDKLTFEIVLHENGDIELNYASLNGVLNQVTVGIEDSDGVDGCQLAYNNTYLTSNTSYLLQYPASGARVKAMPLYQGGFLTGGVVDLPLTIVNTGTSPDSFHFQANINSGPPDGQVKIVSGTGAYLANTPPLNPSQSFSARIRVTASKTGPIGQKWSGTVIAISDTDINRRFEVKFDASMPAPFAAFFIDSTTAYTRYFSRDSQVQAISLPNFTSARYSIARLAGPKYLLTWVDDHGSYSNIKRAVTAPFAGLFAPIANVTDNSGAPMTFDESPQVAVAPNGTIGMVFVRSTPNGAGDQYNSNIYFARLDSNGNLVPGSIKKITENGDWAINPPLKNPTISATPSNSFVITYDRLTPVQVGNNPEDIDLFVVDATGTVSQIPHHLTNSQGTGFVNKSSAATVLLNGNVLIAFLANSPDQPNMVKYVLYHPADNNLEEVQTINEASAEGPRLETLAGGNVILSWVKDGSQGVRYGVFNNLGVLQGSPRELASSNLWKIKQVSLGATIDGNLAFLWRDEWGLFLYYALVDANGSVLTSPMPFLHASNPASPLLLNCTTDNWIAPFIDIKFTFTPRVSK